MSVTVQPYFRGILEGNESVCPHNTLFPQKPAKNEGNPEEQLCQPEENPVHPNCFTWIYILFKIGHVGEFYEFFKY